MVKALKSFDTPLQCVPFVLLFLLLCSLMVQTSTTRNYVKLHLMKYPSLKWKEKGISKMYHFGPGANRS